jgi:hypothetical protein
LSDVVRLPLAGTATTFETATNVSGVFYVRLKASDGSSTIVSNEVIVRLNSGPCLTPPWPPSLLQPIVSGSNVTFGWNPGGGGATGYSLEAGTSGGLTNLGSSDVTRSIFAILNVPAGTYYVRMRARNACGNSGPSIERVVSVF